MTQKPRTSQETGQRLTMTSVANLAGVTQATVSRALNHPERVSAATLLRVHRAMEITGYVPNLVAGALASSKSRMLAAVVPSITNIVYSAMVQTFSQLVRDAGYHTILVESGDSLEEEQFVIASLLSRRPDGILLTGIHHTNQCKRMILASGLPVVEVWDYTENPIDVCVGFSHGDAGKAAAQFAHEQGYCQAATVSAGDERAQRRSDAFSKQFAKLGHPAPRNINFDRGASIAGGRKALSQLHGEGLNNCVVFCSSDILAQGMLIEAQVRQLTVPKDFGIIGFGDQEYAQDTWPPLTTVKVDRSELGLKAADALLKRIADEPLDSRSIDIGFKIIPRMTTIGASSD